MLRILLSVALAAVVAVSTAYAQDAAKKKDGKKGGQRQSIEERFKKMDANKDGKLTLDELKGKATDADQIERRTQMFKRMDANGDDAVTLEEFKAGFEKMRSHAGSHKKSDSKKSDSK